MKEPLLIKLFDKKPLIEQYAENYTCASNVYEKNVARQSLFSFKIKGWDDISLTWLQIKALH